MMHKTTILKTVTVLVVVSFLLNIVWENVQAPLYKGYSYNHFWQHVPMCFAAAVGDVVITIFLFAVFARARKDALWFRRMSGKTVLLLVVTGAAINTAVEKVALVAGWWRYTDAMPLVPFIGIGLTVVLQMAILPPLTFYITNYRTKKIYDDV